MQELMSRFVWADLSTYDPARSREFYTAVFGWGFIDAGGYWVATDGSAEVAGLFETPAFFQKIKMPHFWMSYVSVDDAAATAETARRYFPEAKVETTDDFYGGKVALIRDPQGAGFTAYDGGRLDARRAGPGRLMWNELHVSDAPRVLPFYERLFGWEATPGVSAGSYELRGGGSHVADVLVLPNDVKGEYEYWACTFGVADLDGATRRVEAAGGAVISDEGGRRLVCDDSGEAFFYVQGVDRF